MPSNHTTDSNTEPASWRIYSLSEPGKPEVYYVGTTTSPLIKRLSEHVTECYHKTTSPKQQWVRSLADRDLMPTITLLQVGSGPDWDVAEQYWVRHFQEIGAPLTNSTNGGKGAPGLVISAEVRAKLSAQRKGRPMQEWRRHQIGDYARGRPQTPEQKEKKAAKMRGRKHTEETKQLISSAQKAIYQSGVGIFTTPEFRQRVSERNKQRWEQWRQEHGRTGPTKITHKTSLTEPS